LRARAGDIDLDARLITLYDPKGARDEPRVHVIPLTSGALDIVEPIGRRRFISARAITAFIAENSTTDGPDGMVATVGQGVQARLGVGGPARR